MTNMQTFLQYCLSESHDWGYCMTYVYAIGNVVWTMSYVGHVQYVLEGQPSCCLYCESCLMLTFCPPCSHHLGLCHTCSGCHSILLKTFGAALTYKSILSCPYTWACVLCCSASLQGVLLRGDMRIGYLVQTTRSTWLAHTYGAFFLGLLHSHSSTADGEC
jgi:hypothetical protein